MTGGQGFALLIFVILAVPLLMLLLLVALRGLSWRWVGCLGQIVVGLLALAATGGFFVVLGKALDARDQAATIFGLVLAGFAGLLAFMLWVAALVPFDFPRAADQPVLSSATGQAVHLRSAKALLIGMVGFALVLGLAAERCRRRETPSHERRIACLALAPDESRLVSLDAGGVLKEWTTGGRFEREWSHPSLSVDQQGAGPLGLRLGPRGELAVIFPDRVELYASLAALKPAASYAGAHDAAFEPESGWLVVASERGLEWTLPDPVTPAQAFKWPGGATLVAACLPGEASFTDQRGVVRTLRGRPPDVVRELELGWRPQRLQCGPGGTLLVTGGQAGEGAYVRPGQSLPRLLPAYYSYARAGFLDHATIAIGQVGVEQLALGDAYASKLAANGHEVSGLVASPSRNRAYWSTGRELYVGWTPGRSPNRRASWVRLIPYRSTAWLN